MARRRRRSPSRSIVRRSSTPAVAVVRVGGGGGGGRFRRIRRAVHRAAQHGINVSQLSFGAVIGLVEANAATTLQALALGPLTPLETIAIASWAVGKWGHSKTAYQIANAAGTIALYKRTSGLEVSGDDNMAGMDDAE
jgi:hypothetical protein